MLPLTPDLLLHAYRQGLFPMADPYDGRVYWYAPDPRGVLPLDDRFHVPKTLARLVRRAPFEVVADRAFEQVVRACARPALGREETWISDEIAQALVALHRLGYAHSVECWREGTLVGGLYGIAIGGAFFGESMFSAVRDASKVALVHLTERLRRGGFVLHDVQYVTPHLARFGAYAVPRRQYECRLAAALAVEADWGAA